VVANTGYRLVRRSLVSQNHLIQADIAEVPDEQDATQDALGIAVAMQPPRLVPLDQEITAQADGVLFGSLRFRDPALSAELTAEFRLRPQFPVVEHRCSLRYAGEQQIRLTRLDAADFVIRSGTDARWRAATLDTTGDITFVRLGREGVLEAETPAQSAARAPVIPLLVLHDAARDEGLTFALRWSTNYRITARSLGDRRVGVEAGVRMFAAPELDPAAAVDAAPGFDVHPGQTVSSPWLLLGIFDGAMEDASHALKDYLMADRPREPSWASKVLPVTWNSWFAYGTGVDYSTMLAEAEEARKLAIEVFYVDYGWSAAQGDWTPHPQRFPGRTLIQLADQVHKLGMRFGLWVAFGVADRDSTLLRTHPTFLAKQPAPARTGIDGSLPLCLSTAQTWVQGELTRIVRQYKLDWLKFDQPMVAGCLDPAHKHDTSVRGSLQANTQAFYDILRTLRDQFPELFIESTFDGAGYLDYGVFARSHSAWLDDAAGDVSVPMTVPQQSFYGATLAFPARFLTLWLARGPVGPGVDGRSMSPDDLRYQGYSTMGGSWGLSLRLPDLEPDQRQAVESLMGEYRTFRDLIPGASVYHLQPPLAVPLGVTQGPTVQDWFVLQYVHPDLRRGALLAVRNAGGADQVTLKLRGLEAQTPYQLTWSDGTRVTQDLGQALMQKGVAVALDPFSGGLLWITPTA
jgi:alpha-galactosidase